MFPDYPAVRNLRLGSQIAMADVMNQPNPDMRLKAEAHLRSILATVPDAMVVIDEQGIILSFSAAAEKMFDYREDEVVGRNVKMLMPSPDRERHDQYLTNYLTTGKRKIIGIGRVTTGLHRDGSTFPMELSVGEDLLGERRIFNGLLHFAQGSPAVTVRKSNHSFTLMSRSMETLRKWKPSSFAPVVISLAPRNRSSAKT